MVAKLKYIAKGLYCIIAVLGAFDFVVQMVTGGEIRIIHSILGWLF